MLAALAVSRRCIQVLHTIIAHPHDDEGRITCAGDKGSGRTASGDGKSEADRTPAQQPARKVVNPEPTELATKTDLSLRGPAGTILPQLVELIQGR